MSARNAFSSNQKESSSCEYQQSLMPKGITPIAVRTSQESQTWIGIPADKAQYIHRLERTRHLPISKAELPLQDADIKKKVEKALSNVEMKNKESA
ncbi:hypothetical protein Tco_0942806 [Tanacetum coccineum]